MTSVKILENKRSLLERIDENIVRFCTEYCVADGDCGECKFSKLHTVVSRMIKELEE